MPKLRLARFEIAKILCLLQKIAVAEQNGYSIF